MATHQVINDFLAQEHIAFVGASREPKQFANSVYRRLRSSGRVLYPVNRSEEAATIEGDVAYRRLADVPDPVDLVGAAEVAKRLNTEGPHWDLRL